MKSMISKWMLALVSLILLLPDFIFAGDMMTFPAGSLIIPMDTHYQPEADGGILEAYGLIYYLLAHTDNGKVDGNPDITIYWINGKTNSSDPATTPNNIGDVDFTISSTTVSPVIEYFNHDSTTTPLTAPTIALNQTTYKTDDNASRISYNGSPFIIHADDVDLSAPGFQKALEVINNSAWSAVDVHIAKVAFDAPVHREMTGTPPKIALMDDDEDLSSGNSEIIEAYLRLAGICTNVYDIVSPCQIAGTACTSSERAKGKDANGNPLTYTSTGILKDGGYDFLWTPHWAGYEKYNWPDVEEIVKKISTFIDDGKALFAECASIEVFEHSKNARFLSTKGFAHNGGTNDSSRILFNDVAQSYPQVGDFVYAPEGGHIHNFRPFTCRAGDTFNCDAVLTDFSKGKDAAYMKGTTSSDPCTWSTPKPPSCWDTASGLEDLAYPGSVTSDNTTWSIYESDVTRFVSDDTGWDYYIGGHKNGDTSKGYVIYLGGHKYAKPCTTPPGCAPIPPPPIPVNTQEFYLEYDSPLIVAASGNLLKKIKMGDTFYDSKDGGSSPVNANKKLPYKLKKHETKKLEVEFKDKFGTNPITNSEITIKVTYDSKEGNDQVLSLTYWASGPSITHSDNDLTIMAGNVSIDKDNKLKDLKLKNETDKDISITKIRISWASNTGISTSSTFTANYTTPAANVSMDYILATATSTNPKDDGYLEIDWSNVVINGSKLEGIKVTNLGANSYDINSIKVDFDDGSGRKLVRIHNSTLNRDLFYNSTGSVSPVTTNANIPFELSGTLPVDQGQNPGATTQNSNIIGCTDNDSCEAINTAGVRFVLNTLFDIKYMIISHEFVRAGPILSHPYLYQGSFEWPSWRGHFRRYNITDTQDTVASHWDTAAHTLVPKKTNGTGPDALDSPRQVFTARRIWNDVTGKLEWSKTAFDTDNATAEGLDKDIWQYCDDNTTDLTISDSNCLSANNSPNYPDIALDGLLQTTSLRQQIGTTPDNSDDSDETIVVERIRGRTWNNDTSSWDVKTNRLGGFEHSSPVIVKSNSLTGINRGETAYIGDTSGVLHAVDISDCNPSNTPTCTSGDEKWSFIPQHLLSRIKNDRTDPNAVQEFASLDSSPTAKDIFFDHDGDGDKEWRTLLILTDGNGGNGLTALDVTDPDWDTNSTRYNWDVLWESTTNDFGFASKAAITKIKWPISYSADSSTSTCNLDIVTPYETKWVVFVATAFSTKQFAANNLGGFNIFAYDMITGKQLWKFNQTYTGSHNDIPGAVTIYDTDSDGFADNIYVGDMEGKLWELRTAPVPEFDLGSTTNSAKVSSDIAVVNDCPLQGLNPSGTQTCVAGDTCTLGDEIEVPLFNTAYKGSTYDLAHVGTTLIDSYEPAGNDSNLLATLNLADFEYPISISPAVGRVNPIAIVFGTGGRDWSPNDQHYAIYVVLTDKLNNYTYNSGSGTLYWQYDTAIGEKIWSAPTIANGMVYMTTAFGTMESAKATDDLADTRGFLYGFDLKGSNAGNPDKIEIEKTRGSLYVDRKHVYMSTMDNKIIQFGGDDFSRSGLIDLKAWKQVNE